MRRSIPLTGLVLRPLSLALCVVDRPAAMNAVTSVCAAVCLLALSCEAGCRKQSTPQADSSPSSHQSASASASAPLPSASASAPVVSASAAASSAPSDADPPESSEPDAGARIGDNRLYALAIETYVRALPQRGARAIGYLRVGSSVRRSDQPVSTEGCKGGWYAVEPTGFVCHDDSVALDPEARMLAYARQPARGQPMPFQYAAVRAAVPHYYAKLPTEKDLRKVEGSGVRARIAQAKASADPNLALLGEPIDPPQALLDGERIPRPLGTAPRLRFWVHTGRAEPNTRLALLSYFMHDARRYAITSQLDLVALDRVRILRPPAFHGLALQEGKTLPVAFVRHKSARGYRFDAEGKVAETVTLEHRQALHLTGNEKQHQGSTLLESHDGTWVSKQALTVIEARKAVPTFVKSDTLRWLDISIQSQSLVAYEGSKPVYVTLVSTGAGYLGDPKTTHATPRGLFSIFSKHVSTKMSGDEIGGEYLIDDVPYVQYFHRGYALHAAFWHDDFGRVKSHGCVNLAPADAAWVFEFTRPEVPEQWHGTFVRSGGTPVLIDR